MRLRATLCARLTDACERAGARPTDLLVLVRRTGQSMSANFGSARSLGDAMRLPVVVRAPPRVPERRRYDSGTGPVKRVRHEL